MLTALRNLAGTWVAKILFGLLVLSFAVWGVEDMVRGMFAPDSSIASVGGEKIPLEEGQAQLRRELQRLQRQLGAQFEAEPRIRRALAEQTVDQLVLDRVLRAEQERLKIAVPDSVLRDFVFGIPAFRGADGRFSKPIFDSFLRQNELTEAGLLALVRNDLARQQVILAVAAGATAPQQLTGPLMAWLQEQRSLALVTLPLAAAPEPEPPEQAALERFHENNPERFSTPEMRAGTVAVMNAALLSREIEVSDADLVAAFESHRSQYDRPEKRKVQQVLVDDEAKAKAIAEAWTGSAETAAIDEQAKAAGGALVDLGAIERSILPLPELAEAVFALGDGAVTAPVKSPFGWHVFKVDGIEPGRASTLDEVKEQLRAQVAAERAADIAFERANRIEDALAGGATLTEVAQRFGLGIAQFRLDAEGHDAEHQDVPLPGGATAREPLLKAIFAAERGAPPRLRESEAGFVALELREITPPALRPFAVVADEVRAAWEEDAKRRAQEQRAARLLSEVQSGTPIMAAAAELGLGVQEIGALSRAQGEAMPIPRELIAPVFELKPKQATMARTADGFAVAQLIDITPAEAADPALAARLKAEVTQAIIRDLEVQFTTALRNRADVKLFPRMLDALAQP